MKLLLIGYGYWGKNWARTLNQIGALGAVCDNRPEAATQVQQEYPGIPVYADLAEALAQPELPAAVIVTPVSTHFALTQQCLLMGKSVLVEKPITMSPDEAKALAHLAESQQATLAVGHILMYHPAVQKLHELVQSGELGEILSVQCTRVNLGKIRNEENCWWSLAPHDLSIISLLLNEPLTLVNASRMNLLRRNGLEDSVSAFFTTPSGRYASIQASWYSPIKRHETVVIGTRKIAVFEDTQPPERKLMLVDYRLNRREDWVDSIEKGNVTYVEYDQSVQPLENEALAFIDAVQNNRFLPNDGWNAYEVVRSLDEVQQWLNAQTFQPSLAGSMQS